MTANEILYLSLDPGARAVEIWLDRFFNPLEMSYIASVFSVAVGFDSRPQLVLYPERS